ncbi:MAG: elongator complex protein 3 [Syntrophobacteraceae bacterium]
MTKKDIYPIFLPHAGCPFQCVYCNQHAVTSAGPWGADLYAAVESRLCHYAGHIRRSNRPGEVAFFGGTFTALPLKQMESILRAAASHVESGLFTGIRFSTRPDCMGADIVRLLAQYPVCTVELGVQSLSERVLAESRRGYTVQAVYDAVSRVRKQGWLLGVQLMAGLPGDSNELFLESVYQAIGMGAGFFRFYPTLVLEGTPLAGSWRCGAYIPLSLDDAITRIVPGFDLARRAEIPVVRMGLHSDPALEKSGVILAGPYHPGFGYLVRCRWWRDRLDDEFALLPGVAGGELLVRVPSNKVSDLIGEKRANVAYWTARWGIKSLKIYGDPDITGNQVRIEKEHCACLDPLGS